MKLACMYEFSTDNMARARRASGLTASPNKSVVCQCLELVRRHGFAHVCVFGPCGACIRMRCARAHQVGRREEASRQRLHKTRASRSTGFVLLVAL